MRIPCQIKSIHSGCCERGTNFFLFSEVDVTNWSFKETNMCLYTLKDVTEGAYICTNLCKRAAGDKIVTNIVLHH